MQKRFVLKVEELRRLIDEEIGSASSGIMLLAVSGGMDSMCLADLWLRSFGAGTCALAHCNFNLRGAESDGDEALVTEWAENHGVKLHKVSFDTCSYASENGLSIEMAARELRYRWFAGLCEEYGYDAVVTAHHADDNAETLVLNIVRGTGMKGLSGMKPLSPVPYGKGWIMRPMLSFTRKQIDGHVFAWKVPYRDDSTNSSVEYRRNSIRHEIFPLFERMNPSYVRTLNREIRYFSDASDIVEQWCRDHVGSVCSEDGTYVDTAALLSIPQWRYLLYYILEPFGFNSSVLESLEALLVSDRTASGKRFESEGHVLHVERNGLKICRKMTGPVENVVMPVRCAGTYHFNGKTVRVEVVDWDPGMPLRQPEGIIVMDASRLRFPFVLRSWRSGDWMIPLGMKGRKKVSDIFTDLKYDVRQKADAVVVADTMTEGMAENQHIAALAGVRIDDRYKVGPETRKVIRILI
ncbi:MAG: tRNA lysidine(34) synthetase TilS [Bacteroidales bacterium]|nr:tRNA lysidine(34) synthetase TilS [Bacteroidales bacterium]